MNKYNHNYFVMKKNHDNIIMEELNQQNLVTRSPKERLVKVTFYITYAFLLTTATVTFIEAMRTSDPGV